MTNHFPEHKETVCKDISSVVFSCQLPEEIIEDLFFKLGGMVKVAEVIGEALSSEELGEILDTAIYQQPQHRFLP